MRRFCGRRIPGGMVFARAASSNFSIGETGRHDPDPRDEGPIVARTPDGSVSIDPAASAGIPAAQVAARAAIGVSPFGLAEASETALTQLGGTAELHTPHSDVVQQMDEMEAQYNAQLDRLWDSVPKPPVFDTEPPPERAEAPDRNKARLERMHRRLAVKAARDGTYIAFKDRTEEAFLKAKRQLMEAIGQATLSKHGGSGFDESDPLGGTRAAGIRGKALSAAKVEEEMRMLENQSAFTICDEQGRIRTMMTVGGKTRVVPETSADRESAQISLVEEADAPVPVEKKKLTNHGIKASTEIVKVEKKPTVPKNFSGTKPSSKVVVPPNVTGNSVPKSTLNAAQKKLIRYDWEDMTTNEDLIKNRHMSDQVAAKLQKRDIHLRSPVDVYTEFSADADIRQALLTFYGRYPTNRMIEEKKVAIVAIRNEKGEQVRFPEGHRVVLSLSEGLQLAESHKADLIKVYERDPGADDAIANCIIEPVFYEAQATLEFNLAMIGIRAAKIRQAYEVGFRGATQPHAIWFKSVGIAKHLAHRHPIRISLTKFGTAREAFPQLEAILAAVRKECLQLKAYHTASRISASYHEIAIYLHPSTPRNPQQATIVHPSAEELNDAMEQRLRDRQHEIDVDNRTAKGIDSIRYQLKVDNGTAWAYQDPGRSMRDIRRMKVMLGWMPKSNKDIYERRGDVELKYPFKAGIRTGLDAIDYPRISNKEQATNGAIVLGRRAAMSIEDMHDQNELEGETSIIRRTHLDMTGDAMAIGDLKRTFGIHKGRKPAWDRVPKYAPGYGTMGIADDPGTSASQFADKPNVD